MFIVAYEGQEVLEIGCVGADYYGPFTSENEAQEFIEAGGGDPEDGEVATIIEVQEVS